MTVVTELDLPEIDYNSPDFGPRTYHEQLAGARERGWLAHSPLAYIVLDAESGDFFLRARQTAFPGSPPSSARPPATRPGCTAGRTWCSGSSTSRPWPPGSRTSSGPPSRPAST